MDMGWGTAGGGAPVGGAGWGQCGSTTSLCDQMRDAGAGEQGGGRGAQGHGGGGEGAGWEQRDRWGHWLGSSLPQALTLHLAGWSTSHARQGGGCQVAAPLRGLSGHPVWGVWPRKWLRGVQRGHPQWIDSCGWSGCGGERRTGTAARCPRGRRPNSTDVPLPRPPTGPRLPQLPPRCMLRRVSCCPPSPHRAGQSPPPLPPAPAAPTPRPTAPLSRGWARGAGTSSRGAAASAVASAISRVSAELKSHGSGNGPVVIWNWQRAGDPAERGKTASTSPR